MGTPNHTFKRVFSSVLLCTGLMSMAHAMTVQSNIAVHSQPAVLVSCGDKDKDKGDDDKFVPGTNSVHQEQLACGNNDHGGGNGGGNGSGGSNPQGGQGGGK